jgi:hypothetical protein
MIEQNAAVMLVVEAKKLGDTNCPQQPKALASSASSEQTFLVDIPNPTAGPTEPGKKRVSELPLQ